MALTAKEKLEDFIDKLESLGHDVSLVSKKPQIYTINNELVNVRSRSTIDQRTWGRRLWYSVAFSALQEAKWVIYLATDADHFLAFPIGFLEGLKQRMYPDRSKLGVGIFDIDWDNEKIVLRGGELKAIGAYACNLSEPATLPPFLRR